MTIELYISLININHHCFSSIINHHWLLHWKPCICTYIHIMFIQSSLFAGKNPGVQWLNQLNLPNSHWQNVNCNGRDPFLPSNHKKLDKVTHHNSHLCCNNLDSHPKIWLKSSLVSSCFKSQHLHGWPLFDTLEFWRPHCNHRGAVASFFNGSPLHHLRVGWRSGLDTWLSLSK